MSNDNDKPKPHVLHNIGDPQAPMRFTFWHALLVYVHEHKVTGYAVDSNGDVVNFRKGKRPSGRPKGIRWVPCI